VRPTVAVTLVALLAVACSCGGDDATVDAGIPDDARRFADAAVISCAVDAGCPAGRRAVCDLDRGACVECLGETDCASTAALGPACDEDTGRCVCAGDADCAGQASGPLCHQIARACTCRLDDECDGDTTCELEPYLGLGVRTCVGDTRASGFSFPSLDP
jgi:hypothetical protein